MRDLDRRSKVTRRVVLRGSALAVPGAAMAIAISPEAAWAQAAKNLTPATMATLVRAARDIYPHDHLADQYYVIAVSGYDSAAPAVRDMMTKGTATLDNAARKKGYANYLAIPAESDRVAILKTIDTTAFFNKLRSDLVVTLYNQKPVWAKFGYEGASADKGGYINRGFNDIDWLT